ncbi:MAG: NMD3-related protein [Patescibacteria group bacterium]|nr:NMD3-related protein [Patescibacteria group bacterium]
MFEKSSWRFPKSKKEEAEFNTKKKSILICEKCGAFYWKKSWHHGVSHYEKSKKEKKIELTICPACQMIKDGKYEGEIIIENLEERRKEEVENLIDNFNEVAFSKDPMDRIISIETIAKGILRILTTENQMAQQLAKKIQKTFKGKIFLVHSRKESTLRAKVVLR